MAIRLVGLGLLLTGCGDARKVGDVSGMVSYRGGVVTEGIVSLYSPQLGFGNESALNADGSFTVPGLPFGPYQIAIHPPTINQDFGGKAAPALEAKQVDNIPTKYRNPSTSGFSCTVDGRRVQVDLRME